MGKPGLPPRPTRDADKISASWINRLLDCVEYAMTHPAGDGMTILQSGGILRALQRTRGGGGAAPEALEAYTGSFAVSDVSDLSGSPPAYVCKARVRPGNVAFPAITIWSYAGAEITLSAAGTHKIYAQITFNTDFTAITGLVASVVDADFPAQTRFVDIVPLASVVVVSTGSPAVLSISDITQHHYGDYGADTRLW
jgi:hypothetical protein